MKKPAFIFDIDGTLALRGDRSPYDMRRIKEDAVNAPVNICLRALRSGRAFSVLLFSGRDEAWRPAGSKEPDDLVKLRMLGLVQDEYEIMGVFEDRKRVKRMWVEAGVFVFDVNQKDEEF